MDSSEHNATRYAVDYETTRMDSRNEARLKKIMSLISPCNKLLDVGCWDGFIMSKFLKDKRCKTAVGIDNSKSAVERGKRKNLDIILVESVDKAIPLPRDSVDCVFAGEIIEHLYDVNNFIQEVKRVLKENGQFILTTPNLASFGSRLRLFFGRTPWMIENMLDGEAAGHIRYFTFGSLSDVLESRGFHVVSASTNAIQFGKSNIFNSLACKIFHKLGTTIIIECVNKKVLKQS